MTSPQAEQTAGEEARVKSLDDRFGKIENEQERQGGLLEQILGKLGGDKAEGDPPVTRADEPGPSAGDMAEQMRQAVRDVRAEEAAEAAKQQPKEPEPEKTPREVMVKGKDRLQRALFGSDTK